MEYIFILLILAVVFGLAFLRPKSGGFEQPTVSPISQAALQAFEAAPSLWVNGAEASFYNVLLRQMPPNFHVHGKVRLEDIIRVKKDVPAEARWKFRGRVKSRHVDFLIINAKGAPILAIELDGASHRDKRVEESDTVKTALFAAAQLPLRRCRVGEDFHLFAATIVSELTAY